MNTIKKLFAASAFAICLSGIAGGPVALGAPDTGTYDDQMDLAQETCWGSVSLPVVWEVGDPESAGCAHARA